MVVVAPEILSNMARMGDNKTRIRQELSSVQAARAQEAERIAH